MTTDRTPGPGAGDDAGVPFELIETGRRRTATRRRAAHSLQRASHRRRIVTTSIAGTLVVVGVGVADAGVQATLPTTSSPATAATSAQALASTNALLARVTRALGLDRLVLTQLEKSTKAALGAASPVIPVVSASSSAPSFAPVATPAPATHAMTGPTGAG
jgi:hypothetical protein